MEHTPVSKPGLEGDADDATLIERVELKAALRWDRYEVISEASCSGRRSWGRISLPRMSQRVNT